MTSRIRLLITMVALLLLGALNVQGFIPDDADGDGVPDSVDVCPGENSSYFDRNGDGCIDDAIGARHVEYWGAEDATIPYVINALGAPGVAGTADNNAIVAAFDSWTSTPGTGLSASYGGTTALAVAAGLDHINLVTFADNTYPFGLSTLAVGLSTSFEADTVIAGRVYRKGEIFDADMIFSPTKTFKAGGAGPGSDIQSVATHEAGHLFGLSHTAVKSSTMFYVLPGGLAARTLASDDQRVFYKAYATPVSLAGASRLSGVVTSGQTSAPIGGALVYAINAGAPGDTAACDITLADGSYDFAGLPNGNYYVAVHPLDGTSDIGYISAGNINALVASIVDTDFLPEYYDAAESNMDIGADKTALAVSAGNTTTADVITNIDGTPPVVVDVTPASGTADAAIDGAFLVRFSERVDVGTIAAGFSFKHGATGVGGNLAVIRDDSVIVFTPGTPLAFSTGYTLRIDTDLKDRAGNALASDFTATFTTEDEPPLSISSVAPNKGVPGTTVVINGRGFSTSPFPAVSFNGTPATVGSADPGRLIVTVPAGVTTGNVTVTNPDLAISNALVFTALSDEEVARGYDTGTVNLSGLPHAIALSPDDGYAYIAVAGGVEAVVVDAGLGGYLTRQLIAQPGEFDDVATTPDGSRVYAVSTGNSEMIEIVSDPSNTLLFNTVIATRALNAQPRGIVVDPFGYRAYIATDAAEVQVWDVRLGSPSYQQQVGVLHSPGGVSLPGGLAITPDGSRLLALASSGDVLFYQLGIDSLVDQVNIGLDPRAVAIDPQGERAYVAHGDGGISIVSVAGATPFFVQSIGTGGSLRGLDTTPAGLYLYATDRSVDNLKIVDLDQTHTTFRSVVATAPMVANPVDIALSSDGVYAYSVLQGDGMASPRMVVTTIGQGPTIVSMVPQAGKPGTKIVITGSDFTDDVLAADVDFNGIVVSADQTSPGEVIVTVPVGVTSGPVTVRKNSLAGPYEVSNAFPFELIPALALEHPLREAGKLEFPSAGPAFCDYLIKTIAFSPDGSYLYAACGGSDHCFVFDIRPGSPDFNQYVGSFDVGDIVNDIAITADGKVAVFATVTGPLAFYCNPNDPRFGTAGPAFDFTTNAIAAGGVNSVATSPDNRGMMIMDGSSHMFVDATGLSDGVTPIVIDQHYPFAIDDDVVFHPTGKACFMLNPASAGQLLIYNSDPGSPTYGTVSGIATSPAPTSIDVSRDGNYVFVYSGNPSPNFDLYMTRINCSDPHSCFTEITCPMGSLDASAVSGNNQIRIAPQGNFGIRTLNNTGFIEWDPTCPVEPFFRSLTNDVNIDFAFTPDGRRIYASTPGSVAVVMYDFLAAQGIGIASGNNQTGVAGQVLPAPIRVQVGASEVGARLDGVPVTFEAMNNGMLVTSDGLKSKTVVATDINGFAQVSWQLGDLGANSVVVSATGLAGSGFSFSATANPDPGTLPLAVAEIIPLNGTGNVSPTTALLATFSRAIDPTTIGATTLYLRNASTTALVPATYGFTDMNRKVSLTPSAALSLGTAYELVLTGGIDAVGGSPLTNPGVSEFSTVAAVPLRLSSISPPSALTGVNIVLGGAGFNATPSNNTVLFNNVAVAPLSGGVGALTVRVPNSALPGIVRVVANGDTSNALPFTVLKPNTSPIDEVIATIGSGTGAKSCAVSPDGTLLYTVSPEGDAIVPVDVEGVTTYVAIPVGDQPVAIVIHPDGKIAYVANFNSGTVSVIDIDPASATFNTVIQTIAVGTNPVDLAVAPDGSRLAVANAGSSDVSVVDANNESTTYNQVLASIGSGTGSRSVGISPDGVIYLGTDTGFLVIGTSNEVLANIGTGTGSKSLAISPDGALMFILTDAGSLLVVDIQSGSPSENEVLASIGSGTGSKSVAISGDGTLLYLIPEIGDEVLVIALDVVAGVSATNPYAAAPAFTVTASFVDTIAVGSDPSDVVADWSGSGKVFVVNAGSDNISVINGSSVPTNGPVPAQIEVTPQTLNLQSNGKYVTGRIEIAAFFVEEIDIASIRLQDVIPAVPGKSSVGDFDSDGIADLEVKFDRVAFQAILPQGEYVPVTITGLVRGMAFAGLDTIRTIRPVVTHPHAAQGVMPGAPTSITWTTPSGYSASAADVHVSLDDGANWTPVALQMANTGSVTWNVPTGFFERCRVMVTLWKDGDVLGQGMSQDPFTIAAPVPTRIASFDIALEDGAAVLRWQTSFELGMQGFAVLRAASEAGLYSEVTDGTIAAGGQAAGGRYEYRDESVTANRTYWYKLQEVTAEGPGAEFGPYSVTYKLAYGLEQNVPNPFNPTTTIKYALAADGPVSLVIYDVAGRRVRELVNEKQRADVYKLSWDGTDDRGQRVASGMYFYKLSAGSYHQTRKMLLLK
ncbi:MAG TPA: Ig-like domain-containing protein [Candidatus Krumholzibacteria bacterium]|nr:Ig-like domain-containing protein [Candidatus Krumholzibacteria bacterium]